MRLHSFEEIAGATGKPQIHFFVSSTPGSWVDMFNLEDAMMP
jgi:hypothetical protein